MKLKNRLKDTEKKKSEEIDANILTINENSVADIVSDWTKIPVQKAYRRRNETSCEAGKRTCIKE